MSNGTTSSLQVYNAPTAAQSPMPVHAQVPQNMTRSMYQAVADANVSTASYAAPHYNSIQSPPPAARAQMSAPSTWAILKRPGAIPEESRQDTGGLSSLFSAFKQKKSKGVDLVNSNSTALADPDMLGDSESMLKRSTWLVVGFLMFFIMVSYLSVVSTQKNNASLSAKIASQSIQQNSDMVSERIGMHVRWVDAALASQGTASQVVNTASKSSYVANVAMLDAGGNALASTSGAQSAFKTVSIRDFPKSGIRITSVVSNGGVANPVIVRKAADIYLLVMLAPQSLIGSKAGLQNTVVIDPGFRVIDANATIAREGLEESFGLSKGQISELTTRRTVPLNLSSSDKTVTTVTVPNTDLTLVETSSPAPAELLTKWPYFAVLFFATTAILYGLRRNAMDHFEARRRLEVESLVSQERFRVAVESGRGGVWEIDLKNNTVYLSSSFSRVVGLEAKDQNMAVSQFLSLFHEGDRDRLLGAARRAHLQGEFDIEARATHLPIVLQCRGQTSKRSDDDGSMVIVGVAMDVTEQRGAQSRLQMAEERLYDALNSMTDSFVIWDKLGRLVLWNGKFEDFFGFQSGELQKGMENHLVEHKGSMAIEEIFDTPDMEEHIEIQLKDGRWIRYGESQTADGGLVSIGTDITEIRARERELQDNDAALRKTVNILKKSQVRIMELAENYEQEKIRAEDANQSKSDFLANMSHELRTPLNAINGFSDIMKKEMFGPLGDSRYKEYVSDILFSGQHLLSLINDILDMSKIEAGKMTLNADELQISEMISQVLRIVRGRAEESRLKLVYDNVDIKTIEADARAVKQVLLNLITNAIKFTPEGGTVRVETIAKQAGIIIKVHDSGIGISKENLNRLAKPFEQIESKHSKQHEGTGLGLALSKSLVELHGGNFLMESEPGVGTVVTFTLPNSPPEKKPAADEHEVASEITRLAQDIADVLDENDGSEDETQGSSQHGLQNELQAGVKDEAVLALLADMPAALPSPTLPSPVMSAPMPMAPPIASAPVSAPTPLSFPSPLNAPVPLSPPTPMTLPVASITPP